jgi:hypothetical protein
MLSSQKFFSNAIIDVHEDTYAAKPATTPKENKPLLVF